MKELLEFVAIMITIIAGLLAILTIVYIPNSVAFEIAKYLFLVMIPMTVSIIVSGFRLRDVRKELEMKYPNQTLPSLEQRASQFDKRMDEIEKDIRIVKEYDKRMDEIEKVFNIVKSYFDFKCPNCSNPMFLPISTSLVIRSAVHEKDGAPLGYGGGPLGYGANPEYEISCFSCQKTWHIVYRK